MCSCSPCDLMPFGECQCGNDNNQRSSTTTRGGNSVAPINDTKQMINTSIGPIPSDPTDNFEQAMCLIVRAAEKEPGKTRARLICKAIHYLNNEVKKDGEASGKN